MMVSPYSVTTAMAEPIKIVAFGDSLMAGFGLSPQDGFTVKLQTTLQERGHEVLIVNAGVSGDTTSSGRSRLDWSVGPDTDAVILELGANDMLRGIKVDAVRGNLDAIVKALQARDIPVLIAGMQAAPNLGKEYVKAFNAIYWDLATQYDMLLYPFFLDGVAGSAGLNQADGIHPTAAGVDVIVDRILPKVEELIAAVKK
ncbi:MAG: arylesterase [Hyphomicrobiales bacterium]